MEFRIMQRVLQLMLTNNSKTRTLDATQLTQHILSENVKFEFYIQL